MYSDQQLTTPLPGKCVALDEVVRGRAVVRMAGPGFLHVERLGHIPTALEDHTPVLGNSSSDSCLVLSPI